LDKKVRIIIPVLIIVLIAALIFCVYLFIKIYNKNELVSSSENPVSDTLLDNENLIADTEPIEEAIIEVPEPVIIKSIVTENFNESDEAFNNPFMGYMPFATALRESKHPEPNFTLAFAILRWKDIEAEKDVYDFTAFEESNNFEHMRNHNIKMVIRLVSDYPGEANHMDIPEWLYEEMDGAGIFYDTGNSHSAGFAPDYENAYFIERHELVVKAIAERYDSSPDIAFVQIGSLGQWGEFHNYYVQENDRYFPPPAVTDIYVRHYTEAFKETIVQMRRPFTIMYYERIGFFNDMIGHRGQTDWLTDEIFSYNIEDFYLTVPMGGEFASTFTVTDYFGEMYDDVKQMITQTNVTYAGCLPPTEEEYLENRADLLKTMGYRLYVSSSVYTDEVEPGEAAEFAITVKNLGVAPFYYRWSFYLKIYDEEDNLIIEHELDDWVRDIIPRGLYVLAAELPPIETEGTYIVKLGLFDPLNEIREIADVRLANEESGEDNLLTVGKFAVKEKVDEEDSSALN